MNETWKPVVGWEGFYEVSDAGRVRRVVEIPKYRRGKILSPVIGPKGYLQVTLSNGHLGNFKIHCLVLEAFVGPRPKGAVTRHLDGDPGNSRLANLTWGTRSENEQDKVLHGTSSRGTGNWAAKLNSRHVLKICKMIDHGANLRDIATSFGVHPSTIADIKHGRTWDWLTRR